MYGAEDVVQVQQTPCIAPPDVPIGNTVPTLRSSLANALDASLRTVEADINETDEVPSRHCVLNRPNSPDD